MIDATRRFATATLALYDVKHTGKQLGVTPPGWREAAGQFGAEGTHKSVADIVDQASLLEVRQYKKDMKASKAARPS